MAQSVAPRAGNIDSVSGGIGISGSGTSGDITLDLAMPANIELGGSPTLATTPPTATLATSQRIANIAYVRAAITQYGGTGPGGGVEEASLTGGPYAREGGAWTDISSRLDGTPGGGPDTVGPTLAAIGNNQANAAPIAATSVLTVVTTTGADQGVRLPATATPGENRYIHNDGPNPVRVYPGSGGHINRQPGNEHIIVADDTTLFLKAASASRWISVP